MVAWEATNRPATAYRDGMVGPHWSKGWIIEDCEISEVTRLNSAAQAGPRPGMSIKA